MRKKFVYFMLAILLLPVFALFGCEKAESFSFQVYSSSTTDGEVFINGTMSGSETAEEGKTVTMTATSKNGEFVCWIHQNTVQIADGKTYSITNTKTGSTVTKSVLKFDSSKETSGNYTAIFKGSKMQYVKLASFKVADDKDKASDIDSIARPSIMTFEDISIMQGKTIKSEAYAGENIAVKENIEIQTESVNEVLKLDPELEQEIIIHADLTYNYSTSSRTFRTNLLFNTSSESTGRDGSTTYTISTTYAAGVYKVAFGFAVSQEKTYYLVLYFKELGV